MDDEKLLRDFISQMRRESLSLHSASSSSYAEHVVVGNNEDERVERINSLDSALYEPRPILEINKQPQRTSMEETIPLPTDELSATSTTSNKIIDNQDSLLLNDFSIGSSMHSRKRKAIEITNNNSKVTQRNKTTTDDDNEIPKTRKYMRRKSDISIEPVPLSCIEGNEIPMMGIGKISNHSYTYSVPPIISTDTQHQYSMDLSYRQYLFQQQQQHPSKQYREHEHMFQKYKTMNNKAAPMMMGLVEKPVMEAVAMPVATATATAGGSSTTNVMQLLSLLRIIDNTQNSQRLLQDWDYRAMGVRKCHNKTMQSTSKSRSDVRRLIQKQIALLCGQPANAKGA